MLDLCFQEEIKYEISFFQKLREKFVQIIAMSYLIIHFIKVRIRTLC